MVHRGGLAACGQDAINHIRRENNDVLLGSVGMEDLIETPCNDGLAGLYNSL